MEDNGLRLNKALADAGVCSRRKADELIFSGKVSINGVLAKSPGERVDISRDVVLCDGRRVAFAVARQACWLMLHKPVGVVCTAHDPDGRPTVLDYVPSGWKSRRLYPVGRLDFFSEGLVLLTDDGELAHRLTHPRWHLPRVYQVRVRPDNGFSVPDAALRRMREGMTLEEGERLAPVEVRVLPSRTSANTQGKLSAEQPAFQSAAKSNSDFTGNGRRNFTGGNGRNFAGNASQKFSFRSADNANSPRTNSSRANSPDADAADSWERDTRGVLLEMTLHQGLNRQIRRMCRDCGLTVLRLRRMSQGPVRLGTLAAGQIRELSAAEVDALRKAVGLQPA